MVIVQLQKNTGFIFPRCLVHRIPLTHSFLSKISQKMVSYFPRLGSPARISKPGQGTSFFRGFCFVLTVFRWVLVILSVELLGGWVWENNFNSFRITSYEKSRGHYDICVCLYGYRNVLQNYIYILYKYMQILTYTSYAWLCCNWYKSVILNA